MNCFALRMPHGRDMVMGQSLSLVDGVGCGFVIAPFDTDAHPVCTIPDDNMSTYPLESVTRDLWNTYMDEPRFDENAMIVEPERAARESHARLVREIVRHLDGSGKIVAARRIFRSGTPDLYDTYMSLCRAFEGAYVFMFSTPATGTWIGATPELLLSASGDDSRMGTMSLAGTLPAAGQEPWDIKNIEEQRMVTDFISRVLDRHMHDCEAVGPETLEAGPVRHLCTRLSARIPDDWDMERLRALLDDLAPTPAVCGSDRADALGFLTAHERFDRRYYGGYCGLVTDARRLRLCVTLRCAAVTPQGYTLYSGGGITPLSEPETEWEETCRKAKTLLNHLKFID